MEKSNFCIDAGANVGTVTARMGSILRHKSYGKVYSFEPSK